MNVNPGLGLFSRLPYELREQIWLDFLPAGRDLKSERHRHSKTRLDILRASQDLYDEVSNCLYSNVFLRFDLSPLYPQDPLTWTTVYFNKIRRRGGISISTVNKAMWRLGSMADARSRGFYNIRLHSKIEAIEVNLLAPDPEDPGQLCWLWGKVTQLVEMLNEVPSLPPLTVRLQKCERRRGEGQDWCSSAAVNCSIEDILGKNYDHDVVILPFYTLQNTNSIRIETHSEGLKNMMNWDVIDWASEVFWKRGTNNPSVAEISDQLITFSERDLDRIIASDYFWIYKELFSTCEGHTANLVRRAWLSNWFVAGEIVRSEFEETIIYIINTYPEIIYQYDPELETLSLMHRVMATLHHTAMLMQGEHPDWEAPEWDPELWPREYTDGISSWASLRPSNMLALVLRAGYYRQDTSYGGFFSKVPQIVEEWRSPHTVSY